MRRRVPVSSLLCGALLMSGLLLTAAAPVWRWSRPAGLPAPLVPVDNAMSATKIELGRRLFYDADLSTDGTMACATCHEQKHAFADGNTTHPGVTGDAGRRNVPGLANVAWMSPLTFADPAATTLETQASTPVFGMHPVEMGMAGREAAIAQRLGKDACYRAMFGRAFPESHGRIDFTNVARALASFERTLISRASPFDRGPLPASAKVGATLFARDCVSCHSGPLFTDLRAHRLEHWNPASDDQGLFEKTGIEEDRGRFRTPSLRNVALTGPWWHDGSARTLHDAVTRHGKVYRDEDETDLIGFLGALSDQDFLTDKDFAMPDRACGKRF